MANDLSAFNEQVWSKAVITALRQINFMINHVNKTWEGVLNGVGDTVIVRTVGSIATAPYTRGQTINYQGMTPSKETMTVSSGDYYAVALDDIDKVFTDLPTLTLYATEAAVALNDKVEKKIFSVTPQAYAGNVVAGGGGSAITLDASTSTSTGIWSQIVKAGQVLTQQNVPLANRWMVLDPASYSLLLNDTAHFIRASNLGDGVVSTGTLDGQMVNREPGFMGQAGGFNIYQSNAIYQSGGAKYLPFGTDNAIAYVAALRENEVLRLESTFATALRGLLVHDAKVFGELSKQLGYIYATP